MAGPLDNVRHEKFAQAVARGLTGGDAYRKVYGQKIKSPRSQASDLMSDFPNIPERIKELQRASANGTVMDMKERRELLTARARRSDVTSRDLVAIVLAEAKLAGDLEEVVKHTGEIQHKHTITEEERLTLIERRRLALTGQN